MEKLVRYLIFDIRTAAVFIFLGSNPFFGIRKGPEYQLFNIKTSF